MISPIINHTPNPIQLLTPNSDIMYKQHINPNNGINDKLYLKV